MRSPCIRDSHHQGVGYGTARFFLAQGKDGCAGRVGNRVRIAEIFISVPQGMKGEKVQGAVRHEDQMTGFEMLADRSNEFCVKGCKVALRRGEQRLFKTVSVSGPHAKFRKLKAEQVEKVDDPGDHADRGDLDRFAGHYRSYEPIAR